MDVRRELEAAEAAQQGAEAQLLSTRTEAEHLQAQLKDANASQAEAAARADATEAARGVELSTLRSRAAHLETEVAAKSEEEAGLQAQLTKAEATQQQLSAELGAVKEALGAAQAKVAGLEAAAAHSAKVQPEGLHWQSPKCQQGRLYVGWWPMQHVGGPLLSNHIMLRKILTPLQPPQPVDPPPCHVCGPADPRPAK